MIVRFYDLAPTPAPRQVARDKWKPSPAVQRYRAFRDEVGWRQVEIPRGFFHVVFLMVTPPSWSRKKTRELVGTPHLQTPDTDNLMKALLDGVFRNRDDSHVWNFAATKLWAGISGIMVSDKFLDLRATPVDLDELIQLSGRDYDPL